MRETRTTKNGPAEGSGAVSFTLVLRLVVVEHHVQDEAGGEGDE